MKKILNIIFPIYIFRVILKSPFFCRHKMIFYDMRWVMDPNSSLYRHNGKIWKDSFCECQRCGIKKKMIMLPGRWGEWKRSHFETPKNGIVEVEIFEIGRETRSQKRDRIINNLLK